MLLTLASRDMPTKRQMLRILISLPIFVLRVDVPRSMRRVNRFTTTQAIYLCRGHGWLGG